MPLFFRQQHNVCHDMSLMASSLHDSPTRLPAPGDAPVIAAIAANTSVTVVVAANANKDGVDQQRLTSSAMHEKSGQDTLPLVKQRHDAVRAALITEEVKRDELLRELADFDARDAERQTHSRMVGAIPMCAQHGYK
jgi:hypothetical protein